MYKYCWLLVGNITQPNASPLINKNSKIFLLDIRNYTWVGTFEAKQKPVEFTSTQSLAHQLTTTMTIVIIISGIVGIVVLIGIWILLQENFKNFMEILKTDNNPSL